MPRASTEAAVSTTASEYVASLEIFAVRRTPDAAPTICQKPSNAEAAPACFPNGESVCAVPKRVYNFHAKQKDAHAAEKWQEGRPDDRGREDGNATRNRREQTQAD